MDKNEIQYQLSLSLAKELLKNELITQEEYHEMMCILLEKYQPFIGELLYCHHLTN